jgi:hypothetical protein
MQFFLAVTVVYAATTIATNLENCCEVHLLLDYRGAKFISYIVNSVSVVKTCQDHLSITTCNNRKTNPALLLADLADLVFENTDVSISLTNTVLVGSWWRAAKEIRTGTH